MAKEISNEEVHEAFGALQEAVKTGNKEMEAKVNVVLDAQEDQNQKLVTELSARESMAANIADLKTAIEESSTNQQEARDRVEQLEVSIARAHELAAKPADFKETVEYQNLNKWCRDGISNATMNAEALRTDVNVSGGFLVPSELDNEIVKQETELNPMRSIARVRTLTGKSLDVPKRSAIPTATFEGEAEAGGDSESTYELQSLTPFRQTFSSQVTQDMINDSAFDIESEMSSDAALAFADGAGTFYVNGDGIKKPFGFVVDADVIANNTSSGDANLITFAGVMEITGALEAGFDPRYVFNRTTLAAIRSLVSTTGQPLWEPGINGIAASSLSGVPYTILPAMPNIAAGAVPLAYGDFRRGYTIADRTGMSVVRDDLTLKKQAIIEFTWNRWTTGDVVLPQAIRILTIEA